MHRTQSRWLPQHLDENGSTSLLATMACDWLNQSDESQAETHFCLYPEGVDSNLQRQEVQLEIGFKHISTGLSLALNQFTVLRVAISAKVDVWDGSVTRRHIWQKHRARYIAQRRKLAVSILLGMPAKKLSKQKVRGIPANITPST